MVSSSRIVSTAYGATSGPGGGSGSRPEAPITIRSTGPPRSSTARAAITLVLPGVEPIPSTASRPAARKRCVQLDLLAGDVEEAAQVDVVRAGARAPPPSPAG